MNFSLGETLCSSTHFPKNYDLSSLVKYSLWKAVKLIQILVKL